MALPEPLGSCRCTVVGGQISLENLLEFSCKVVEFLLGEKWGCGAVVRGWGEAQIEGCEEIHWRKTDCNNIAKRIKR